MVLCGVLSLSLSLSLSVLRWGEWCLSLSLSLALVLSLCYLSVLSEGVCSLSLARTLSLSLSLSVLCGGVWTLSRSLSRSLSHTRARSLSQCCAGASVLQQCVMVLSEQPILAKRSSDIRKSLTPYQHPDYGDISVEVTMRIRGIYLSTRQEWICRGRCAT